MAEQKKEKNNDIKISIDSENFFILTSDNPDIDGLISKIVELKDSCDFNLLNIETENEDFDIEGFKEILIKSINEFLNAIKLNEENLQKFLNEISDDSYDSEQNKN